MGGYNHYRYYSGQENVSSIDASVAKRLNEDMRGHEYHHYVYNPAEPYLTDVEIRDALKKAGWSGDR